MDQGTSDGVGHIYVASNTGYIVFVDMTISGLVGSPDFVDAPFCDTFLDDLAPDCGLGGRPNCPRSQGYWKTHGVRWPVATTSRRASCATGSPSRAARRRRMSGAPASASPRQTPPWPMPSPGKTAILSLRLLSDTRDFLQFVGPRLGRYGWLGKW
jgi:hypothetical protein